MAYVEWHQEIWSHYKTHSLMRILGIPKYQALGIIGAISSWSVGNRPGGIFNKELVAIAVEWDKDPGILLAALLESGWLEEFDKKQIAVHDWEEITKNFKRARKDAKRKHDARSKERREAAKSTTTSKKASTDKPADSPQSVRGQKRPKAVRGQSAERRAEQNEQNEQNERTRAGKPPSSLKQQPQKHPVSSSSTAGKAPEGDAGGLVVAVPDRKEQRDGRDLDPQTPVDVTERLQQQVSSRLSAPILEAIGVDQKVAEELSRAFPAIRILHVCEHAKGQDNPGGFARKALEDGWSVPDSNGAGLRNLQEAVAAEIAAKDAKWSRMGGMTRRAADFPARAEGESEEDHTRRVNEWMKSKKTEGGK